MIENLVVQIILPKGLALQDGTLLNEEVTFSVCSALSPFYSSADLVRMSGGAFINTVSDFVLSLAVFRYSREADVTSYNRPSVPDEATLLDPNNKATKEYNLWLYARQSYVTNRAAYTTLSNIYDSAMSRGSKTLGNFSVQRISLSQLEGVPRKISELEKEVQGWSMALKSGGSLGFNGHIKPVMAAKMMFDPASSPPGRLWQVTGMGANRKSIPGFGSNGRPFKYMSNPLSQWYNGRHYGVYMALLPAGTSTLKT